jgi:hypothetical protein
LEDVSTGVRNMLMSMKYNVELVSSQPVLELTRVGYHGAICRTRWCRTVVSIFPAEVVEGEQVMVHYEDPHLGFA